jgi:hypothetical protein
MTFPPAISMLLMYLVSAVKINCYLIKLLDILIKEWFEHDHLVAFFNKCHKSAEHAFETVKRRMEQGIFAYSPSFAPVVIVTSVLGSISRPMKGE